MPFQVEELSLELIDALAPLMPRIKQRDKDLADQLRRAASSIGLNCAEAAFSDPGNRRARLFTAAGSAGETRPALRQAVAWRHVTTGEAGGSIPGASTSNTATHLGGRSCFVGRRILGCSSAGFGGADVLLGHLERRVLSNQRTSEPAAAIARGPAPVPRPLVAPAAR